MRSRARISCRHRNTSDRCRERRRFPDGGSCRFAFIESARSAPLRCGAEAIGLQYTRGACVDGYKITTGRPISIAVCRPPRRAVNGGKVSPRLCRGKRCEEFSAMDLRCRARAAGERAAAVHGSHLNVVSVTTTGFEENERLQDDIRRQYRRSRQIDAGETRRGLCEPSVDSDPLHHWNRLRSSSSISLNEAWRRTRIIDDPLPRKGHITMIRLIAAGGDASSLAEDFTRKVVGISDGRGPYLCSA